MRSGSIVVIHIDTHIECRNTFAINTANSFVQPLNGNLILIILIFTILDGNVPTVNGRVKSRACFQVLSANCWVRSWVRSEGIPFGSRTVPVVKC